MLVAVAATLGIGYWLSASGVATPKAKPVPAGPKQVGAPGVDAESAAGLSLKYAYEAIRQDRLQDAENSFGDAMSARPDSPEPLYGLALVFVKTSRNEEAIDALHNTFELDKNYVQKAIVDEIFAPLRREPHFQALLRMYDAEVPEMYEHQVAPPAGFDPAASEQPQPPEGESEKIDQVLGNAPAEAGPTP